MESRSARYSLGTDMNEAAGARQFFCRRPLVDHRRSSNLQRARCASSFIASSFQKSHFPLCPQCSSPSRPEFLSRTWRGFSQRQRQRTRPISSLIPAFGLSAIPLTAVLQLCIDPSESILVPCRDSKEHQEAGRAQALAQQLCESVFESRNLV